MSMSPVLPNVLSQLAIQTPLYVAYTVGSIFALTRWRRHPRASLLTILGAATLGITSVVLTIVGTYIPSSVLRNGGSFEDVATYTLLIQIVRTIFNTLGISLLLAAVFVACPFSKKLARFEDDLDYPVPDDFTRPDAASENVYQKGKPRS